MTPRQDGIVPFPILVQFQVADDGKTALAEFMSFDRKVLLPILTSTATGVKAFEKRSGAGGGHTSRIRSG